MNKIVFTLLLFFVCGFNLLFAEDSQASSIPTSVVNGVNVITGEQQQLVSSSIQNEFYEEGENIVGDLIVTLPAGDSRIGRVKLQTTQLPDQSNELRTVVRFFYFLDHTEIIDGLNHKSVYRFTDAQFLTSVEQFEGDALYRIERLFWKETPTGKQIVSRTLEDSNGQIWSCALFEYDAKGQIIKESVVGNLSGNCKQPIVLDENGLPKENGVEKYSVTYVYSAEGRLVRRAEDNGSLTVYAYDGSSSRCISKIVRDRGYRLLSRYFYSYDSLGLLNKTIVDDGQSMEVDDLTGVTSRQIIKTTPSHEPFSLGQPLVSETMYLDIETGLEISLEQVRCVYTEMGLPLRQEFFDGEGALSYTLDFEYDASGNLIKTTDSRGEVAKASAPSSKNIYNFNQQQVASIDKYGNETDFEYDGLGRLTRTVYPPVLNAEEQEIRPVTSQGYDIADNMIESQDANGHRTHQRYNIRGKPIEIIHPDGSKETFTYYLDGSLKESVSKSGKVSFTERDAFGRPIRSEERSSGGEILTVLLYDYRGALLQSVSDGKSYHLRFSYDGAGRQIGSIQETPDGIKRMEWAYDAAGQQKETKEWFDSDENSYVKKVQERDLLQQIIETRLEDSSGNVQSRSPIKSSTESSLPTVQQEHSFLNSRGQYVLQKELIDERGVRAITTHDALGRVESIEVINSYGTKLKEQHFRYDPTGNKVLERHLILANGEQLRTYVIMWRYNACNKMTDIIEGVGSVEQKNTYYQFNESGDVVSTLKPDGTQLIYEYDSIGRLTSFEASDLTFAYRYSYDEKHRLTKVEDLINGQTGLRSYNAFNQMTQEVLGNGLSLKQTFDLAGRRVFLELPDQSEIAYHYDGGLLGSVERVSSAKQPLYEHGYRYDESGRVSEHQLIKGLGIHHISYDAEGRFKGSFAPHWSEEVPNGGYDTDHNLTRLVSQDPKGDYESHFKYTEDHQLASDSKGEYSYDSLYNRLSSNGQVWEVNSLNQLVKTDFATYRYDANGNRIEKREGENVWRYEYDALDRLIRVSRNSLHSVSYTYDSFHRRLSERHCWRESPASSWVTSDNSSFLYDGEKEIGKADTEGNLVELRVLGIGKGAEIGSAIALELRSGLYAPIHDHQGSVRCLIDAENQTVAEFYRYSSYGNELIFDQDGISLDATAVANPWRFSSKRCDEETGLTAFGKRYYDPAIGRWLTPDPIFFYDAPNLYAFVKNNPMTHFDLYGHFSISSIWGSMQAFAGDCFTFLTSYPQRIVQAIKSELIIPACGAIKRVGKKLQYLFSLIQVEIDEPHVGVYGKGEKGDKVRVTLIHGLFTTHQGLLENLELLSESHGGVNVHYVFRPTAGWMFDIGQGFVSKIGFATVGYRSSYAYLLAEKWKELIREMGGTKAGGVIIHYAHSLGGTDTDRARDLLTPEEQRMIRVVSLGSSTLIAQEGFNSVTNYVSVQDAVCWLDPFGWLRNFFDPKSNLVLKGSYFGFPEHTLACGTYTLLMGHLGRQFLTDFCM